MWINKISKKHYPSGNYEDFAVHVDASKSRVRFAVYDASDYPNTLIGVRNKEYVPWKSLGYGGLLLPVIGRPATSPLRGIELDRIRYAMVDGGYWYRSGGIVFGELCVVLFDESEQPEQRIILSRFE